MTRRELREHIFSLVFRADFFSYEDMPEQIRLYFEALEEPASDKDAEYIETKSRNLFEVMPELDKKINEGIEGWNTERMGKAELAIIRLALYEVIYDDEVPTGVAINEAVELAKKYGAAEDAGAFVNGILSKLTKE